MVLKKIRIFKSFGIQAQEGPDTIMVCNRLSCHSPIKDDSGK